MWNNDNQNLIHSSHTKFLFNGHQIATQVNDRLKRRISQRLALVKLYTLVVYQHYMNIYITHHSAIVRTTLQRQSLHRIFQQPIRYNAWTALTHSLTQAHSYKNN